MKSLQTLVRARQRLLDEKRRALNELEMQEDRLIAARRALADEKCREGENIRAGGGDGYGFGSYLAGVQIRDAALREGIRQLEPRIEAARDEIAEAFAEIKRLELIEAAQVERARRVAAKREQDELDELGLNVFRRSHTETT